MKSFWTLPKKVVLTTVLALLYWFVTHHYSAPEPPCVDVPHVASLDGDTDEAYLRSLYAAYNDQYFDNHLPAVIQIDTVNRGPDMADSWCDNYNGTSCHISFYLKYTLAPRVSQEVMLHEMCHVRVWSKLSRDREFVTGEKYEYDHSHPWRACMIGLDTQGAFREILIDNYQEELK